MVLGMEDYFLGWSRIYSRNWPLGCVRGDMGAGSRVSAYGGPKIEFKDRHEKYFHSFTWFAGTQSDFYVPSGVNIPLEYSQATRTFSCMHIRV
jgi:hypothetical protein